MCAGLDVLALCMCAGLDVLAVLSPIVCRLLFCTTVLAMHSLCSPSAFPPRSQACYGHENGLCPGSCSRGPNHRMTAVPKYLAALEPAPHFTVVFFPW